VFGVRQAPSFLFYRGKRLAHGPWEAGSAYIGHTIFGGFGADGDVAFEYSAFIDDKFAGGEIAFVSAGLFQLDAIAGEQIAMNFTFDNDRSRFDIGLDFSLLGDVQPAGGSDFSFEPAMDFHAFFESEFAFESRVGAENGWIILVDSFRHVVPPA
jgi:hypothetical protein